MARQICKDCRGSQGDVGGVCKGRNDSTLVSNSPKLLAPL